jgi:hypothetical protein
MVAFPSFLVLDILKVFQHPLFEGLLSASNVGFPSGFAFDSIDDYGVSANVVIITSFGGLGPAVALSGSEVLGDDISVELTC